MRRLTRITSLLLLLVTFSCVKETPFQGDIACLPEGTPVMLNIGFGIPDFLDVKIGTKAEATRADEARVHDLYVMLFDGDGTKFYGRYFTYEHLNNDLSNLDSNNAEGWYVENSDNSRGVVKISTQAKENCTLVLLANVSNTITSLKNPASLQSGGDAIDCLAGIGSLSELQDVRVTLEQEVVNRSDLFLMMGYSTGLNTGSLTWGSFSGQDAVYNKVTVDEQQQYQLQLSTIDAKIKFCIRYNETNINKSKSYPRNWWVFNAPSECFLFPKGSNPSDITYFNTEDAFFEGTQTINGDEWEVFSFYLLENRQSFSSSIENPDNPPQGYVPDYYLREKEVDASKEEASFIYAPQYGTYVKFDMLLGLETQGIINIDQSLDANHALTSEVMYTIHMGDFTDSDPNSPSGHNYDDYNVLRSHSYTYFITINNSSSIYVEVNSSQPGHGPVTEIQPGQEGSLLLSTDEIVNCDAHYEYHSLTFSYTPKLLEKDVSWFIKTPFDEGGAQWNPSTGDWSFPCDDYLWVKFGINKVIGGKYSENRTSYPGENAYDPDWDTDNNLGSDRLVDIHQLFKYIMHQTRLRNEWLEDWNAWDSGGRQGSEPVYTGDFIQEGADKTNAFIRLTAFVDEYYYERDPRPGHESDDADPDLWRKFVNAPPRELHILSDASYSEDGQSDVIMSSHSIIQQSIQTFYNIYSPDLRTLWGTEHTDEMEYRIRHEKDNSQTVWRWWPESGALAPLSTPNDEENGRVNTAAIWRVQDHPYWSESTAPYWEDRDDDNDGTPDHTGFLSYSVDNNTPELKDEYKYLAYSCLTRNRDNNGNGVIDPEEIRWYTAAVNQLVGMWVGNESLSPSARLYQPRDKNSTSSDGLEWRAWVVSSTASSIADPKTIRAEEGATKSDYSTYNWMLSPQTVFSAAQRHEVSSVRCVRNIGTFNNNGRIDDISAAPFERMVDQYYESPAGFDSNNKVLPNADGSYTLRFSRINTMSLREYTSVDLPYHEEYSAHNRVYMELNMQDPANSVYTDKVDFPEEDEETINNNITRTGHNTYCPPGYRMPNMTELLLMVALQPSSYWSSSSDYPCRTHFSRGKNGSKETPGETVKLGWGYTSSTKRFHMLHEGNYMEGIRCVRDINCTGDITGKISVPNGDRLQVGKEFTIKLNFSSMGSAIRKVDLYLVYVNTQGAEDTQAIPHDINLSGVSIRDAEVKWTMPDIPILGDMYIRADVRNNAGISKSFETPVRVMSSVFAAVRLLPCEYSEEEVNPTPPATVALPSFPIMLTAASPDSDIASWKHSIWDPEGESRTVSIAADGRDSRYWSTTFDFAYSLNNLITGTYSFQLEVTTEDGDVTRSAHSTMDILKVDFQPNNLGNYTHSNQVTVLWEPDVVEDVSFQAGDFVESVMDLSDCTYISVNNNNANDSVGKDCIISIGITDTDHATGMTVPFVYHIYYPARDSGQNWLRPNISTSTAGSNGYNYKEFTGGDGTGFDSVSGGSVPDINTIQHFRLEKSGAYWNGQKILTGNWSGEGNPDSAAFSLNQILNSNTLYVGSTQGVHHSRAHYYFVRAVHNSTANNAAGGNAGFDNDLINGGKL